jgi:hypothetical protein
MWRIHCEPVDEIVHRVTGVPLDLLESDVPRRIEGQGEEGLPEVLVGDGSSLTVAPVAALPADPPTLLEAVHDISRIARDHQGTL